jgi:hypothetical protein
VRIFAIFRMKRPHHADRPAVDATTRVGRSYAHHATVML